MKDEGKIGVKVPLTSWQWKIFRDFGEVLREHGAEVPCDLREFCAGIEPAREDDDLDGLELDFEDPNPEREVSRFVELHGTAGWLEG